MIFSNVIKTETVVVLLFTLGKICASTQELCITKKLKILFFDNLLPKLQPITIGVLCRPPNPANLMDLMVENLTEI